MLGKFSVNVFKRDLYIRRLGQAGLDIDHANRLSLQKTSGAV